MVKTKEELMKALQEKIGESTEDSDISLIEDISDTFDSFAKKSEIDWEQKYKENDANWREKYKSRFFNPQTKEAIDETDDPGKDNNKTPVTIESLFETKK